MDTKTMRRMMLSSLLWLAAIAVTLTSATYAWFTSNSVVSSSRATARSGTDTLELQISSAEDDVFRPVAAAEITQINDTDMEYLMPVSTADLKTFFYCPALTEKRAVFREVTDEQFYYHGRIYLRALAEGIPSGRLALYLDRSAVGALAAADDGYLLNAARLGLTFDGGSGVIFYLSDDENAESDQIRNTYLDGSLVSDGNVLSGSGDEIIAVADPAVPLSEYTISLRDSGARLPDAPLIYMALNRVYTVDVYFYLEGCDPDCSEAVSFDEADIQLAFYGILAQ